MTQIIETVSYYKRKIIIHFWFNSDILMLYVCMPMYNIACIQFNDIKNVSVCS